ncbi:TetR/AcrR family transcriptional regulator [Hydrogenophaga sp. A37]|uniref:TetR/AcrR family transcriptional regulator n=1 Tax=Hydrogenophaga sp. A37 TaxID=1945864 RepID=UPI00209B5036|nr:TetR/AcrR family transcriptional regulator [Hydrogenophaga sp. A37]
MRTERPSGAPRRRLIAQAEGTSAAEPALDVRDRILETASRLFYERGVRAVGVDLVVLEAAVAKTSLYRYFPTKDDLIVAFLEKEDIEFWAQWSRVAAQFPGDPLGELDAHMRWIGERLARSNYRGCPQINVAAEFAEQDHPSRQVSRRHMHDLRERLLHIAQQLKVAQPDQLAAQLAVFVNGAFVSSGLLNAEEATAVLQAAVKALVAGARGEA